MSKASKRKAKEPDYFAMTKWLRVRYGGITISGHEQDLPGPYRWLVELEDSNRAFVGRGQVSAVRQAYRTMKDKATPTNLPTPNEVTNETV